jgi:IS5 family transposase
VTLIADRIRQRLEGGCAPILVSLDGRSGVGKSTLAAAVAADTEFGYKVAVADTPEGFVMTQVYRGNPSDGQTLEAAIAAAQAVGMKIRSVAADRGFGDVVGDQALAVRGITEKVIPRKGRAAPIERTRNWRRRYRWRAGSEGRISCLKREYGLRRTRLKGRQGAGIWVGFGALVHNLDRMVALS